jgi:hypothetical protein
MKPVKMVPPGTAQMVKQFYVSNEIGSIMSGAKDYISVNLKQEVLSSVTTDIV